MRLPRKKRKGVQWSEKSELRCRTEAEAMQLG